MERITYVKKNNERVQEQNEKRKLRRLTLNRETIQPLNESGLLELARGGIVPTTGSHPGLSC
jgi:hypothetical protein